VRAAGVVRQAGHRIVGSTPAAIASTIQAHAARVLGAVLINPMSPDQFERVADSAVERERKQMGGEIHPGRADDPVFLEWSRRASRLGASATEWAALLNASQEANKRFVAEAEPILDAPPILLVRRRDAMNVTALNRWTDIFPDAECVTVEGADAGVMALDAGLIAELAAGFITGAPIETPPQREFVAVGDPHSTATKPTCSARSNATSIDLHHSTQDLGLDARTGIHVGEVEHRDDDIGGIAVHLAARVMGQAQPGEIIVTSTVVESSTGGTHRFSERGKRTLKGIDRPWQLFAVDPNRR
jgi:hypothetical protein